MAIHPGLTESYAVKVADLAAALNDPEARTEAADLLRGLIESVTLTPDMDAPNGHQIELMGELGAIFVVVRQWYSYKCRKRDGDPLLPFLT